MPTVKDFEVWEELFHKRGMVSFIQLNFTHANNIVFEEQQYYKLVRENSFTSDWYFFEMPIVAKWTVKKIRYPSTPKPH